MECFSLNVFDRDTGSVWQNRSRGSTRTAGKAILSVSNKCHCYEANACKGARFVQVALDSDGKRLAVGDRHGHIYLIHLEQNRFWLVTKLGSCSTAISFTPLNERDLLVATANCSLHVFESVQRRHISHLAGHPTCISRISVDKEGRRFLTSSLKRALVWDLLTLGILHQLNFHLEENMVKSIFIPPGTTFLTALKEGRILVWSSQTFEFVHQLKTLPGSTIRTLDVSSDGHLLAAGGRVSWLLVWRLWDSLGEDEEPSVLSMGAAGIKSIRHVAFMAPSSQADPRQSTHILGVVSHEGVLHFYEVETQAHLLKLSLEADSITTFRATLFESQKFAVLTFSGKMLLYDLDTNITDKGMAQENARETGEDASKQERQNDILPQGYSSVKNLDDATVSLLKGIVKEYGQYPEKYRYLIWRSLLSLPNNEQAFTRLCSLPPLSVFHSLRQRYPLASTTDYRALQRILSLLCHWCPRLAEIPDLPLLVFPFVKLFYQNLHLCFELLLAFICNWCQNWWLYYPSAPFRILTAAESLLSHHDPMLLLHFIRHGVTAEVYVWVILKSLFSELVSRDMWLILFDHVLSNRPSFLLYVAVAFNILCRKALMNLSSLEDIKGFFSRQQNVSIRELTRKAYLLRQRTPANIRESCAQAVGEFSPLVVTRDSYPTFSNFPSIGINAMEENQKARERIDYIKSRQDKLLNMQAAENVRLCRCSPELPPTIRPDTCACVRVPREAVTQVPESSPTKTRTKPKELLRSMSPVKKRDHQMEANSPTHKERSQENELTEVIRRVMETRKKLSQQIRGSSSP